MNTTNIAGSSSNPPLAYATSAKEAPEIPTDVVKIIGEYATNANPIGNRSFEVIKAQEAFSMQDNDRKEIEDESVENLAEIYHDPSIFTAEYPVDSFYAVKKKEFNLQMAAESLDVPKLTQLLQKGELPIYEKDPHEIWQIVDFDLHLFPDPALRLWRKIRDGAFCGVHHLNLGIDKIEFTPAVRAAIYAAHANQSDTLSWLFDNFSPKTMTIRQLASISKAAFEHHDIHFLIGQRAILTFPFCSTEADFNQFTAIIERSLFSLASSNQWNEFLGLLEQVELFLSQNRISLYINCINSFNTASLAGNKEIVQRMLSCPVNIIVNGNCRSFFKTNLIDYIDNDFKLPSLDSKTQKKTPVVININPPRGFEEDRVMDPMTPQYLLQQIVWRKTRSRSEWSFEDWKDGNAFPIFYSTMLSGNPGHIKNFLQLIPVEEFVSIPLYQWDLFFKMADKNNNSDVKKCMFIHLKSLYVNRDQIPDHFENDVYLKKMCEILAEWDKNLKQGS